MTSVIAFAKTLLSGTTDPGDKITASPLQVTKLVSFIALLAGGIVQALKAAGAVDISVGDMVTIWLVAAGLSVLLVVVDISARAYVTASELKASGGSVKFDRPIRVDLDIPGFDNDKESVTMTGAEKQGAVELAKLHMDGAKPRDYTLPMDLVHAHQFQAK